MCVFVRWSVFLYLIVMFGIQFYDMQMLYLTIRSHMQYNDNEKHRNGWDYPICYHTLRLYTSEIINSKCYLYSICITNFNDVADV